MANSISQRLKLINGDDLPAVGEFLVVRLPGSLSDLLAGSFPQSTTASRGSTSTLGPATYHTVIVKTSEPGREAGVLLVNLEVWVVVTRSKADEAGKTSVDSFLS